MIKYKRDLVFEVMIDENQQFVRNALKLNNFNAGNQAKIGYGTLSIDSCFSAFSAEETLSG
jgi:hypothetical protein